ncbi:Mov34/MPN/PAD-1 family protein [Pseudomonas aeruginosa]|nr:hypothetical protein CD799_33520 [Pseudomonas aeruginosa]MCG7079596.1 Mov34/MPN/PAD-1 family protein [Pseudomonas aeruginosa]MCG7087041.1 Mov34/MPN/PAD-1 family protein [Pseudomonas aeruginosa]MCG7092804.1 Mov34/MPN/PAD-1 family protein [Pseudomonas aeruginosa]MCG7098862.1 Mov34/MPN/PAD-1 family protein [Pseudomonas aeruginosa]
MLPGGSRYVLFTQPVLDYMYSHAQRRWWQKEAGGEIFSRVPDSSGLIIDTVAGPNPNDRRSRHSWNPDCLAGDADRLSQFQQGLHAVGLWHTHPEPVPQPSARDRETTIDYLKAFNKERSRYLMVIIGNRGTPPTMSVWITLQERRGSWVQLQESAIPLQ